MDNERVEFLFHPPYSPDFAPCDFSHALESKKNWREKGRKFGKGCPGSFEAIPKNRLEVCIEFNGKYYKGINSYNYYVILWK